MTTPANTVHRKHHNYYNYNNYNNNYNNYNYNNNYNIPSAMLTNGRSTSLANESAFS